MAKQQWGKDVSVKYLGGEVIYRVFGEQSEDDYVKNLDGIAKRSMDLRPAHLKAGEYWRGSVARNFEAQGRPSPWAKLKPETIKDRLRKGYSAGPILVRSKLLKNSLTQAGALGSLFKATPKTLQYGSSIKYFKVHQDGTSKIPKRVMVIIQKQDRAQISRIYNRYVKEGK